jgi:hypothetical protein
MDKYRASSSGTMREGRAYFGDFREENLEALLRAGDCFTHGVTTGEEWIAFVDTMASNEYAKLVIDVQADRFAQDLEKINASDKLENGLGIKNISKILEQILRDSNRNAKNKVDEDELISRMKECINETVMHEVSIHVLAGLPHNPVMFHVTFPKKSPERKDASEIMERLGLKAEIWSDETGKVKWIEINDAENQEEKIVLLHNEFGERGIAEELWCAKKIFPVKFELRDIKILDKEDLRETIAFYKVSDPSTLVKAKVS